jgi:hypothetical protein
MKDNHGQRAESHESMFRMISKWWLMAILLFMPFQSKVERLILPFSNELSNYLRFLDELTVVIFLPVALARIYVNREFPFRLYVALLLPLLLFTISGTLSGLMNGNSLTMTTFGIFDYIQYFAVIFVYAAFFDKYEEINKITSLLIKISILLVVIALYQEISALISRYILDSNIFHAKWRLGIYRPQSLLVSVNTFGLYLLLVFAIYYSKAERLNYLIFIILLLGIILSVSRIVYAGLILLCLFQMYRKKMMFIYVFVPVLTLFLFVIYFTGVGFDKKTLSSIYLEQGAITYSVHRDITKKTAKTIWKDNIVLGSGPGKYSDVVFSIYDLEINYDYNSLPYVIRWHLNRAGTMHQFWYQLLAEMGIIGVAAFCLILAVLLAVLLILRIWAGSYEFGQFIIGLIIATITIIFFTLATGLNPAPIMFTYNAIVGIAIGSQKEQLALSL